MTGIISCGAHARSCLCSLWYLTWIGVVRFTGHLTLLLSRAHSTWDPSGHVFIYGLQVPYNNAVARMHTYRTLISLQLIPLWATLAQCNLMGVMRHILLGVEASIWFFTVTTVAFFHDASEVAAAWTLILGLAF